MSRIVEFNFKNETVFITLNRPEKRNALNPELIKKLLLFFTKQQWELTTKVIVISGFGKCFCSGVDLNWLGDEAVFSEKELKNLFSLLKAIECCALPVVVLTHGFSVGGGLGLIAVADVVIATQDAQFCFSETKLGLIPSVISSFIIKKIGLSQAKFFMLSALAFSAKKAQQIGLVHFVGEQKECDIFLNTLLNNFKQLDCVAVSKTKKWLNDILLIPPAELQQKSVELISESRKTVSSQQRIKKLFKKLKSHK